MHVSYVYCWMNLLVETCLRQHPKATVAIIHRCIGEYLKLAPHRAGGAGKGCHVQAQLQGALDVVSDCAWMAVGNNDCEGDVDNDGSNCQQ